MGFMALIGRQISRIEKALDGLTWGFEYNPRFDLPNGLKFMLQPRAISWARAPFTCEQKIRPGPFRSPAIGALKTPRCCRIPKFPNRPTPYFWKAPMGTICMTTGYIGSTASAAAEQRAGIQRRPATNWGRWGMESEVYGSWRFEENKEFGFLLERL